VYCFLCKVYNLFAEGNVFSTGFSDWRTGHVRVQEHEASTTHKDAVSIWISLSSTRCRIDSKIAEQYESEKTYWRNVLQRVVAIVKFLAERGLPFRGRDEQLGSVHNGNFLGIAELLAQFDPFLSEHLGRCVASGRGNVSYLSSQIYEELILLMGNEVKRRIFAEIKLTSTTQL
jgi:hypothetical protein